MKVTLTLVLVILIMSTRAQHAGADSVIQIPGEYLSSIDKKTGKLDKQLSRKSEKYLNNLSKQEEKILRKLSKLDSSRAKEMMDDIRQVYEQFSQKLAAANGKLNKAFSGQYLPGLDSLQGALGFLKDAKNIVSKTKDIEQRLGNSLQQVKQLQDKLQQADQIKQFVQQRQQQLKSLVNSYTNVPKGLTKHLGKYQQEAYYYSRQVQEYKEALNDPDKLVKKVLVTLQTLPAFKTFMQKHSLLAQLFPTPENYGTPQALAGLQTRANVQQVLQQQMGIPTTGGTNANPAGYLQQQIEQAQGELSKLKEKLNQLGNGSSGSSDMVIPDFKPNDQKTKSFLQRIELGTNFQTQRSNSYFPTTTDAALTAGYKLNDKSIVGIGVSGKIGWGKSWKQIRLTGEGVGFRAFADWKAPDLFKSKSRFIANLWFTMGGEMNYNRTVESLAVFKNYSNWTKSALAGITKKYSIKSPLKKGKQAQGSMQILYDFLHKQHIPPTPAFVWRVGYSF